MPSLTQQRFKDVPNSKVTAIKQPTSWNFGQLLKQETSTQVPEFIGIPSPVIRRALYELGLDLEREWWKIIQSQGVASETLGRSLDSNVLPTSFKAQCQVLADQIKSRFRKTSPASLKVLKPFISNANANQWRLMVRSTGKEDTEKLANAGGNLTIGNVSPDMHSVSGAIGSVIASYFEEKSLSQRLSAGDTTLFDLPLTPVLLQRMIGEALNGASTPEKIPVGCVMYTTESAASLKSVHTLQCSYGHNEGVVESLVPLDTYYVDASGRVQSIIKHKNKRIVPMLEDGIFGLEEQNNPESLSARPALDNKAIQDISRIGTLIDQHYQKRMDIELVYEPWTRTTYIVQARPLVIPESTQSPSYLTKTSTFKDSDVSRVTSINPGDSAVQRIEQANQLIIAQNLNDALHTYNAGGITRSSIIAIIVAEGADPTSHAAAVFRGDSKLIFESENISQLRSWLAESPLSLMIDTQRGLILNTRHQSWMDKDLRDLFEERILKSGWLNYPLPLRVSVGAHQPQYCLAPYMHPETFLGELTCLTDRLEDRVRELNLLTERTRARAFCDWDSPGCLQERTLATSILPKLEDLNTHAHELVGQIESNKNTDLPELMTLFPKRFLESLAGQPQRHSLADAYSLESVQQEYTQGLWFVERVALIKATSNLSDKILKDPVLFRIAQAGERAALTPETAEKFIVFIDTQTSEDHAKLVELIDGLDSLGILAPWLNSKFLKEQSLIQKPLLTQFHDEYRESQEYLAKLQDIKSQLKSYDLSIWNDPPKFARARMDFRKKFETYFQSNTFLEFGNSLETMAAVSIMETYVELFDQSIKTLKSSPDASTSNFRTRVSDYFQTLKVWALKAPRDLIKHHEQWPVNTYLNQVDSLLVAHNNNERSQFLPSQEFSVSAAALGAATDFSRHFPETLEDFFTLVHQSLNTCMGAWNTKALASLQVPAKFEVVWKQLETQDFSVFLTGVSVTNGTLTYSINMPLRNHSAKLKMFYDRKSGQVDLSFDFIGPGRIRWGMIRDYSTLWTQNYNTQVRYPIETSNEIELTLDAIDEAPNAPLAELKNSLAIIANEDRFTPDAMKLIEKLKQEGKLVTWIIQNDAISLVTPLYPSTLSNEQALEIARVSINSLNPNKQAGSVSLLGTLARNKIGIADAIDALKKIGAQTQLNMQLLEGTAMLASNIIRNTDETQVSELGTLALTLSEQNSQMALGVALTMYMSLIEKEQYCQPALVLALRLASGDSQIESMGSIALLAQLTERNYQPAFTPAFAAAKLGFGNPNQMIHQPASAILGRLASQNQERDEIMQLIVKAAQDPNPLIAQQGYNLLYNLQSSNIGIKASIELLTALSKKENPLLPNNSLGLARELYQKKLLDPKVFIALITRSLSDSQPFEIQMSAVSFLVQLVNNGSEYWLAKLAIKELGNSQSQRLQADLTRLASTLNQKGQLSNDESLEIANKAIESQSSEVQSAGLNMLGQLINSGVGYQTEALKIAENAINNPSTNIQNSGLSLLTSLVGNGTGTELALSTVEKFRDSINTTISQSYFNLVTKLFQKKLLQPGTVLEIANNTINNPDPYIQLSGLRLLRELVNSGHGYQESVSAIKKVSPSSLNQYEYTQLISELSSKNLLSTQETLAIADSLIKSPDNSSIVQGLELLKNLVSRHEGYDAALNAIASLSSNSDPYLQGKLLYLSIALMKTKQIDPSEVFSLAKQILENPNRSQSENHPVYSALWNLVDIGFEVPEIAQTIKKLKTNDFSTENTDLILKIVNKGYLYDYSEDLIKNNLDKFLGLYKRSDTLQILKQLASNGKAFNTALEAASAILSDTKANNHDNALDLLSELVKQGYELPKIKSLVASLQLNPAFASYSWKINNLLETINKAELKP